MNKFLKIHPLITYILSTFFILISIFNYANGQDTNINQTSARILSSEPLKLISKPMPKYTAEAKKKKIQGNVTLKVTFLDTGKIGKVEVVSGLPFGLTEEAIKAAQSITFQPARKDGIPQTVTKQVQYSFTSDFDENDSGDYDESDFANCSTATKIALKGFGLGMTINEVLKKLNLTKDKIVPLIFESEEKDGKNIVVEVGNSKLIYENSGNKIDGILYIYFKFYENKVYEIFVIYDGSIKWNNLQDFIKATSKSLYLPLKRWEKLPNPTLESKPEMSIFEICPQNFLVAILDDFNSYSLRSLDSDLFKFQFNSNNFTVDGHLKNPFTNKPIYNLSILVLQNDNVSNLIKTNANNMVEAERLRRKKIEDEKKKVFKP